MGLLLCWLTNKSSATNRHGASASDRPNTIEHLNNLFTWFFNQLLSGLILIKYQHHSKA
jgi:hypothetical protein